MNVTAACELANWIDASATAAVDDARQSFSISNWQICFARERRERAFA
jgi:hypothetical protein